MSNTRESLRAYRDVLIEGGLSGVDDVELALLPRTDLGNSKRLIARHGDRMRYAAALGWHVYDGIRWKQSDLKAQEAAKATALKVARELEALGTPEVKTAHRSWARSSQSVGHIQAMLKLAQSAPEVHILPEDFDESPMLLNLKNATLDLNTSQTRDHNPQDLLTKVAGARYDPDATCPRWKRLLREIMYDTEMIHFIQRAVGYTLTGRTDEQCMFYLYGTGANGKSTFVNTLAQLLGEYYTKTSAETLLAKDRGGNSINNDVAALDGARLVVASEMPAGRTLNESLVKDLTGGDPITARYLYKEYFTFTPVFKLWMYGNYKPEIVGTNHGIWRRLKLIPFEVQIPKEEQDPDLPRKLREELPGILNWALEGLAEWREDGLATPQKVKEATDAYRAEMDVLQPFIDERCLANPSASEKFSDLYGAYKAWADATGTDVLSGRKFGDRLTEKGFARDNDTGNVAIRRGIALRI